MIGVADYVVSYDLISISVDELECLLSGPWWSVSRDHGESMQVQWNSGACVGHVDPSSSLMRCIIEPHNGDEDKVMDTASLMSTYDDCYQWC